MKFVVDEKIVKRMYELLESLEEGAVSNREAAFFLKYLIEDVEAGGVENG